MSEYVTLGHCGEHGVHACTDPIHTVRYQRTQIAALESQLASLRKELSEAQKVLAVSVRADRLGEANTELASLRKSLDSKGEALRRIAQGPLSGIKHAVIESDCPVCIARAAIATEVKP